MNTQPYPARLDGQLDPALSRWLWLVKWPNSQPPAKMATIRYCGSASSHHLISTRPRLSR
jgi:hypothetical protein